MKNNRLNIRYRVTPDTHSRKIRRMQVFEPKTSIILKHVQAAEERAAKRHSDFLTGGFGAIYPFLHTDPIYPQFKNHSIKHDYNEHKPTESFRCTSIKSAMRALSKRNKEAIISAVYADNQGNKTILI